MQPFLEIEIAIVNSEKQEKTTTARIQPSQIEYYYPGFYEGTIVVMKSGQSLMTLLSDVQLDAILVEYNRVLKANTGKFGNVSANTKKQMHATS